MWKRICAWVKGFVCVGGVGEVELHTGKMWVSRSADGYLGLYMGKMRCIVLV